MRIFANAVFSNSDPFGLPVAHRFNIFSGSYASTTLIISSLIYLGTKKREFLIAFLLGLISYTLVILSFWLYVTSEYEGRLLASYYRYFGVYFLAFTIFAIKLGVENNIFSKKKYCALILVGIIPFFPSPRMLFPSTFVGNLYSIAGLSAAKYYAPFTKVEVLATKIKKHTTSQSKIWIIWQRSDGEELMTLRYEIIPRTIKSLPWSFGEKYYDEDVWTNDFGHSRFLHELASIDVVGTGSIDKQFIDEYGEIFIPTAKSNSVYKKTIIDGKTRLLLME
jgi:hypothetical protein